jgi:hypothetical protein
VANNAGVIDLAARETPCAGSTGILWCRYEFRLTVLACRNYWYGGRGGWLCGLQILLEGMIDDYDNQDKHSEGNEST